MGSIGHPCSTIQGSAQYLSLMSCHFPITSLDLANNPCSTIEALRGICFDETGPTTRAVLFKLRWGIYLWWDQVLLLPRLTNNHYPRPGLDVVTNSYNLARHPTASMDKAFFVIVMQFSISRMIKRRQIWLPFNELIELITIFLTGGTNCATLI